MEHIKAVESLNDAKADLAFVGGKIRTPAHPSGFVQALAVRGGVIQALGTDEDIRDLTGPGTRVVDLRGRLALPAFGDAHVHPIGGGLESLRCNLLGLRTRPEYLDVIAAYCAALPPDAWVLGGGWTMAAFPGGTPVAADLDAVTGGRPAFLPNRDHHSAWVNTAALAIAGVDAGTPDPEDGRIERDEAGRPAGALHDGAMRLVAAHVPPDLGGRAHGGPPRRPRLTCTHWASRGGRTPASARPGNSASPTRSTSTAGPRPTGCSPATRSARCGGIAAAAWSRSTTCSPGANEPRPQVAGSGRPRSS